MLFKIQVNWIKIEDFRNLTYVDVFGLCWPQNSKVVQFSDIKFKWSSNLKSIGWKLRILENMAQFGLLAYDLKISRWLNSATGFANDLQILSQSDENWQF